MLDIRKARWLVVVAVCIMILGTVAGCGGSTTEPSTNGSNGVPSDKRSGDPGQEASYIDWSELYPSSRGFKDGQVIKMSLWQKIDGEESSGWITVSVSKTDDELTFEYAGELEDYEFSNTCSFEEVDWLKTLLSDHISNTTGGDIGRLWDEIWIAVLENYDNVGLEKAVDKVTFDNYEMEAAGYKTFAGQTGINLSLKVDGKLLHEVCVSPDVPVNLYSYTYDHYNDNEYRVELVEYTE